MVRRCLSTARRAQQRRPATASGSIGTAGCSQPIEQPRRGWPPFRLTLSAAVQAVFTLTKSGLAFAKTADGTDYTYPGFDISGIRILYNAFLDWRRAPLSLHNATDVNVIGNYFGPPLTNYVPLGQDVIADLWVSDYPNLRFANNVNATTLPDSQAINEDGASATVPNAFQAPAAPQLEANLSGAGFAVNWVSPSPGFVLQQTTNLVGAGNNWSDVTNALCFQGASNITVIPLTPGGGNMFYRLRQR